LREQVKRLEGQLAQAQGQVEQLTTANKRYQRQIASIGADAEDGTPRRSVIAKETLAELKALAGEQQRRKLRPTDAELLDDDSPPEERPLLAEAKRLKEESEKDEVSTDIHLSL
jgi:Tfp pilus assembly protein FimV